MKRPLFVFLIGLVLGELAGRWLNWAGLFIPASLLCVLLLKRRWMQKKKPFFIFLGILIFAYLAAFYRYQYDSYKIMQMDSLAIERSQSTCIFGGKVLEKKALSNGFQSLYLSDSYIEEGSKKINLPGRIQLTGEDKKDIHAGDLIRCQAVIQPLEKPRNPGAFDERNYLHSKGIYLSAFYNRILSRKSPKCSIRCFAENVKIRIENSYRRNLYPKDSAMLLAMVLGDKSELEEGQKILYQENGVAHLLAVSGLHMAIIGGQIYRFLRRKGRSYLLSCAIGGVFLFIYGLMTGFGTSVLRSFLMYSMYLVSEYSGMSYDMISSLSFAADLMLLEQSRRLFEGGFLVSYASIIAIGIVLPIIKTRYKSRFYKRNPTDVEAHTRYDDNTEEEGIILGRKSIFQGDFLARIGEKILESAVVYVFTLPLILRFYYRCTPFSFLINLLVIPCMSLLMTSAMLGGLLACFCPKIRIIYLPAILILRGYDQLFQAMRKLPYSTIVTGCPKLWMILLLYIIEFLLLYLWIEGRLHWKRVFFLASFFMMVISYRNIPKEKALKICMLDVGQGDCILIQLPQGDTMLIDGGSTSKNHLFQRVIYPALSYYGIDHLDYLAITHMDEDHISGIREMLEADFPIRHLLTGKTDPDNKYARDYDKAKIKELASDRKVNIHEIGKGDTFRINDVTFTCLHPQKGMRYKDANDESLVLTMSYHNFYGWFPGDLGSEFEDGMRSQIKHKITFLKVAHHGSKYSTGEAFLKIADPTYAFISAGEDNRYGHPHKELIERLEKRKTRIFKTIDKGAICFETDGEKDKVSAWMDYF